MIAQLPEGLLGVRDRALLLVGFAGVFRRSELTALDRDAVDITSDGLVVKALPIVFKTAIVILLCTFVETIH